MFLLTYVSYIFIVHSFLFSHNKVLLITFSSCINNWCIADWKCWRTAIRKFCWAADWTHNWAGDRRKWKHAWICIPRWTWKRWRNPLWKRGCSTDWWHDWAGDWWKWRCTDCSEKWRRKGTCKFIPRRKASSGYWWK